MADTDATRTAVRILFADDHPSFRDGLRRLLEAEPDLLVVGQAVDAAEAIAMVEDLHPDILLLDVAMPKVSGLEALETLVEMPAQPKVILLTAAIDRADIVKALQIGARGVVLKESATSMLLKAIRIVMDGGYWVGRESVSDLLLALRSLGPAPERPEPMPAFSLTPREIQIVGLILAAAGNKKIADTLNISEKTVKHHLTNIFEKLGVSNRLELALYAAQHNLLPKE
jgi:two-component system, NarL family, nitrate/nitrite response regulator NarL